MSNTRKPKAISRLAANGQIHYQLNLKQPLLKGVEELAERLRKDLAQKKTKKMA